MKRSRTEWDHKKSAALKDKASSKKQHTGRGRGSCDCVVIKLELHRATNALWQLHSLYIYSMRLAEVNLGDVGCPTAFHLLCYECGAVADAVDWFFFLFSSIRWICLNVSFYQSIFRYLRFQFYGSTCASAAHLMPRSWRWAKDALTCFNRAGLHFFHVPFSTLCYDDAMLMIWSTTLKIVIWLYIPISI